MHSFSPLIIRIALAKTLGTIIGIIAFFMIRKLMPTTDPLLAWGVLALFVTIGGLVGISGIIKQIPLLNIRYSPILRGGSMGAWLGLVAAIFGFHMIQDGLITLNFMGLTSPWLIIIDAFIAGAFIDVICTRMVKNVPNMI